MFQQTPINPFGFPPAGCCVPFPVQRVQAELTSLREWRVGWERDGAAELRRCLERTDGEGAALTAAVQHLKLQLEVCMGGAPWCANMQMCHRLSTGVPDETPTTISNPTHSFPLGPADQQRDGGGFFSPSRR